jgi:aminopeptidase
VAADSRVEQYARLLVEDCVDVQPGWQVLVRAQPLARPLYEEVLRQIGARGAYALPRLTFGPNGATAESAWLKAAPQELLDEVPDVDRYTIENIDCLMVILAPENTRESADVPQDRMARVQKAFRPLSRIFMSHEKPWVGCQYPTHALAQDAGMSLEQFEEFLYGAVLIDWDALEREMRTIGDRFDSGDEVRIVADGTDLRLSLAGRSGRVSGAGANMPSGEVFYSPVEDSAEGEITFSEYPGCYLGREAYGIRLRFEQGRVVEASAEQGEDFLLQLLDTDEGARRLGEFGIGCNPGIQRHMKNTLFDEKIEGTIHLALGQSYLDTGGTNESAIHWDIVKDLREGGRIEVDGEVVQENGRWRLERLTD